MAVSEQVLRDLRDVVRATRAGGDFESMNDAERLVFRVLPALLDEVESLRDGTLQKDFVALYQAARSVTGAWHPAVERADLNLQVEGLGLHVVRLAPLYDDLRFLMRDDVRARASTAFARVFGSDAPPEVVSRGTYVGPDGVERSLDSGDLRLPSLLPDGVLTATPDELADIVQRQVEEQQGRGIINPEAFARVVEGTRVEVQGDVVTLRVATPVLDPPELSREDLVDDLAVPIVLGPTLRPRIEKLVATHRLGVDLEHVVQTLFVLGMLDAEGHEPLSHVGDPALHVSAEALFVRFAIPHEDRPQRAAVLRRLFVDLSEWFDANDPLRPSLSAALECLPR